MTLNRLRKTLNNMANKRLLSPIRGWDGPSVYSAALRLQVRPKAGR